MPSTTETLINIRQRLFGFSIAYDPILMVTSSSKYVSPAMLFGYRVFVLIYCLFFRLYYAVFYPNQTQNQFFTLLSYSLLCTYFGFSVALSLAMKSFKITFNDIRFESLSEWSTKTSIHLIRFAKVVNIIFEILVASVMTVALVYWTLLAPAIPYTDAKAAINDNIHGINVPLVLIDLFINRIAIFPGHVFYLLIWVLLYMFTTWIVHAANSYWVYFFLNWSSKLAIAYYLGVLVLLIIFFYIGFGLSKLRDKIGSKIRNRDMYILESPITPTFSP